MNRAYNWFLRPISKRTIVYAISKYNGKWFYNSQVTYLQHLDRHVIMPLCVIVMEWSYYFNNVFILKLKWRKLTTCYISLTPWYYTVVVYQGALGSKKTIEVVSRISLPIGTNGKPLAAIVKFPNGVGILMIGKTSELPILWLVMMYWQFIGNHWIRLVMIGKTLVHQIRIINCYSNNMTNVIKRMRLIVKWLVNNWQW